jgi:DNA-binding winged helix-turn-helix (wHTH) protein
MLYIINKLIKFRNADGFIWTNSEDDGIKLTRTTSRLLTYLLERNGEVVLRDDILAHVWDAHGLRTSNNSLNKYISDLRAIFRDFGVEDDIIFTVPRAGFRFFANTISTEINIKEKEKEKEKELVYLDKKLGNNIYFFHIFSLILIFFIISMYFSTRRAQDFYYLGKIDKCTVESLNKEFSEDRVVVLGLTKKILIDNNISCSKASKTYVKFDPPIYHGYMGRVFLSVCNRLDSSGSHLKPCLNIYETHYEINK